MNDAIVERKTYVEEYLNIDIDYIPEGEYTDVAAKVKNSVMTGKAVELLSFISSDTTVSAYYEELLGQKLSRDEDSLRMLDLIFDSLVYDPGANFFPYGSAVLNLFYIPSYLAVQEKAESFAVWYAQYSVAAAEEMKNLAEQVALLD